VSADEAGGRRKRALSARLYLGARSWHLWLGPWTAVFAVVLGVTGIWLNHKELFVGGGKRQPPTGLLHTRTTPESLPVSFADALAVARSAWGEIPLEKVELREEGRRLLYKVVSGPGRELLVDAQSGAWQQKDGYRIWEGPASAGPLRRGVDWKKVVTDLHTGKIARTPGKLAIDAAALAMIVLSLTGLYLWAAPRRSRGDRPRQGQGGPHRGTLHNSRAGSRGARARPALGDEP
jgi:hypothetical protein